MSMRTTKYAEHVALLCKNNEISVSSHSSGGRAWRKGKSIQIREVKSAITYAVALHEIGHVLGPDQSKPRLFSEAGAWKWAKENCLEWTDTMDNKMRKSLQSYLTWAEKKHARKVRNAPTIPPEDHYFWSLVGA